MTTASGDGRDDLVFRAPDRLVRIGLVVSAATFATGPLVVVILVRHSVAVTVLLAVLHVVTVVVCCRIASEQSAVDADGIVDRRTFRRHQYRWRDVAAVGVDSPGGPWGGLCVRIHPRRGRPVPLLGTRCHPTSAAEGLRVLEAAHTSIEERLARSVSRR